MMITKNEVSQLFLPFSVRLYGMAVDQFSKIVAISCLFNLSGCSSETDEQLLARLTPALQAGSFHERPDAVRACLKLFKRGHPKATEPTVVDCLIRTGAQLLTNSAQWRDRGEAEDVYDMIKRYDNHVVIEGLVRKVLSERTRRLHVLFLAIKLGIPGSQERLNQVLDELGDKQMAEDFLNSGSSELHEGGARWANRHGYSIDTGPGSHRASWGRF